MFPGMRPQLPLRQPALDAKYIAFVSGLGVGEPSGNPARLSLLLDFLTGMLGSASEQRMASRVVLSTRRLQELPVACKHVSLLQTSGIYLANLQ